MFAERMRYVDALEYVKILRPDVRPNDGFQRQLKAFETTVRRWTQPCAQYATHLRSVIRQGFTKFMCINTVIWMN